MLLSPTEWEILWLSLKISGRATVFGMVLAVLASLLLRRNFPGRPLIDTLLHTPLVVPPVVTGFLLLSLFGLNAPVGRFLDQMFDIQLVFTSTGASVAAAVTAFPLMLRAIRLSLDAIDPRLEQAAQSLGARKLDRILTITLPLAFPGIVAAAVIGFAAAMGAFGAVITFAANIPGETRTIPLAIYTALQVPGGEAVAIRLSIVAIMVALGALWLSEGLLKLGVKRAGR